MHDNFLQLHHPRGKSEDQLSAKDTAKQRITVTYITVTVLGKLHSIRFTFTYRSSK